jgi:hypothetical protein
MITENLEDISKILLSQNLSMQLATVNHKSSSYLSSVLSLVCRWPPFDFAEHKGYCYQRIKSPQLMRVTPTLKKNSKDLLIIPTDDEKLKVFIIPESCLSESAALGSEGSLMLEV